MVCCMDDYPDRSMSKQQYGFPWPKMFKMIFLCFFWGCHPQRIRALVPASHFHGHCPGGFPPPAFLHGNGCPALLLHSLALRQCLWSHHLVDVDLLKHPPQWQSFQLDCVGMMWIHGRTVSHLCCKAPPATVIISWNAIQYFLLSNIFSISNQIWF